MNNHIEILVMSQDTDVIEAIAYGKKGFRDLYEHAAKITLEDNRMIHGEVYGTCRIIIDYKTLWPKFLLDIAYKEEVVFLLHVIPIYAYDPVINRIIVEPNAFIFLDSIPGEIVAFMRKDTSSPGH